MLPASEIRRRGNRRRTCRHLALGAGACALVLTAGVALTQTTLLSQVADPMWANSAEPSPVAPMLDWAMVPGVEGFFAPEALNAGRVLAQRDQLGAGKGLCDPGEVGAPSSVLVREISGVDLVAPFGWATVLQYDSSEAATVGFETIRDAALNCQDQAVSAGLTDPRFADLSDEVPFEPSAVAAKPVNMAYLTGSGLLPGTDEGIFSDTLVVQAGDRVLWLTETVQGQDFNCSPAPTHEVAQCSLPAALPKAVFDLLG